MVHISLKAFCNKIQYCLWLPINSHPIFFWTYSILLYIPEIYTVDTEHRLMYFGAHLFTNFVFYGIISYLVILFSLLFDNRFFRNKTLFFIYHIIAHFILYSYSIGDLFCVRMLSTRYTSSTIQLIFQTNENEISGFLSTYILNYKILSVILPYFILLFFELIVVRISWNNFLENCFRWWKFIITSLAIYIFCIDLPFFQGDYNQDWNDVNINGKNESLKTNTLWQFHIGLKKQQETKNDLNNLLFSLDNIGDVECKMDSSLLVIVIGESYNKSHSQLYGYSLQTTPLMTNLNPIKFMDVITPSNMTNYAFRHFLSPTRTDDSITWTQAPLFPSFFKKSGYSVVFYSNQYAYAETDEDVYNWRTSFYMNHPTISNTCFTHRNNDAYEYDLDLINEFECNRAILENNSRNLIIFHLLGQHFHAKERYPSSFQYFTKDSIQNDLEDEWKQKIAEYDNATRYNDYVINKIFDLFKDRDALMLYFSDHGDEVCDYRAFYGRSHEFEECNWKVMHSHLDIPFLFFPTDAYRQNHPEIISELEKNTNTPFMIDDLPHLMFYLGGIDTSWYDEKRNPLSPTYNKSRHRIVTARGEAYDIDYDSHQK